MKTQLARAPWPQVKPPKQPKPRSRIDVRFQDWAKRNDINLKDIPVMEKKK